MEIIILFMVLIDAIAGVLFAMVYDKTRKTGKPNLEDIALIMVWFIILNAATLAGTWVRLVLT